MRLHVISMLASLELAIACGGASNEPEVGKSDAPFDETGRSEAPPTGGAGYDFGMKPEAARARCAADKGKWKHEAKASSCTQRNEAAKATRLTILEFCRGSLCRIHTLLSLDQPDAKTWLVAFDHLRRELEKSYGAPDDSDVQFPAECEKQFSDCLRNGTAAARLRWRWEDGHAVMLLLGPTGESGASLAVSYASAESAR